MHTISSPAGQRTNIILADGTRICLNSNSELQYPAFFSGDERRVVLKGEAYFDVTHDASQPFIVETDDYNVQVLGTQFNVEAYPGYEFVTSLQTGKVSIINNDNPSEYVILEPGQQAISFNNEISVRSIGNMDLFRWTEGLVCFENATFETLMKQFEKSYGVKIIIQNSGIDNKFSGKFKISDGIEHAFYILQKSSEFTYQWNEDRNIVYVK